MTKARIENIRIAGIAAAVSNKWTPLTDFEGEEDIKVIKKFIKKTGVEGRFDASLRQTTSDFCFAAAKKLMQKKRINPKDIGVLVFVTQTADYGIPSTACVLQDRLGINKECIAFDINLGCSGYTYGINVISALMKISDAKYGLLLAGDTSAREKSRKVNVRTSHSESWLFGDSGTATLVAIDDNADQINSILKTDGSGFKAIIRPYGEWRNPDAPQKAIHTYMNDVDVFNFAISEAPDSIIETMKMSNSCVDDYDCLVLHQANLFILKQIAKRSGFDMEKTLVSLDKFGNTSSASIPISLVKQYGNETSQCRVRTMMCGFGVGLSWATADISIDVDNILPLIHTDDFFQDGYDEELDKLNK